MPKVEDILAAREHRKQHIERLCKKGNVIAVKANIVGADKNIAEACLIVRHFASAVAEKTGVIPQMLFGADGMCAVCVTPQSGLKQWAVDTEETHPLGRFADIDVYENGLQSQTRGYMRKCYLCDKPAFVCGRLKSHSQEQLLDCLKNAVRKYFAECIADAVKGGMLAELNLENKFGLVTPTSNGSHTDLDYNLMRKAQEAVIPYLTQSFFVGLDSGSDDNLLALVRQTGLRAERAMFEATGGVNAYKGLIFAESICLAAAGAVAKTDGDFDGIFRKVSQMCGGILREFDGGNETFGKYAYNKWKFAGARGHAQRGFCQVKKIAQSADISDDKSLLSALTETVGAIDDTVLLKRCGSMEKYLQFKNKISSVDVYDDNAVRFLNEECIKNNVSIGGSADVLAVGVTMNLLSKRLCYRFD
ncbi:MAG: triphosphoribosyl-dephospho-CoA synthase [Corallococcus sp.]|nr:triphosphoribosyl-dephospho-CoA synthase [Corallococcus sp.]